MKICAVIITHNRTEYIAKLMSALDEQTFKEFNTFVFDASTTEDASNEIKKLLPDTVKYSKIKGHTVFDAYYGALKSVYDKYDWLWMLHDDAIPDKNALAALVDAVSNVKKASFFTSMVNTPKHTPSYMPPLSPFSVNGQAAWGEKLEYSLVRIGKASFISTFINSEAIKKCGLPTAKSSFKDNSDYLSNLVGKYGAAYLVGKSKVTHYKTVKSVQGAPATKLKICAIVVTYNRKEMLLQCVKALHDQKYNDFDILVVDNASTDGTKDFIVPHLKVNDVYVNTGANLGGSGGFYYGMKYAYEKGYDWLWIMDDDVVPTPTALGELVGHLKFVKTVSFLASAVYSKDNKALNTPEISRYSTNGYRFWYDKLEYGMIRLAHATFVSLLVNRNAITRCGLPCKDYFIWGDDTEYTMRIIGKFGAAYMVGSSKVYHLRGSSSALDIKTEKNKNRVPMYYNLVRNTLLNAKTYSGKGAYRGWLKRYYKDCIKIAFGKWPYRKLKIKTILSAILDFKRGNYAAEAFKNRYQVYGQEKAVISFIGAYNIAEALHGQYGYTVPAIYKGASVFTLLEPIPAYIKEYNFVKANKVTVAELQRKLLNRIQPVIKNQYLVVDFSDSCNQIGVFERDGNTFMVNYTQEFNDDYQAGYLNLLRSNYNLELLDVKEFNDVQIEDAVIKFVLFISKYYMQDKIIFIKYEEDISSEYKASDARFVNLLVDKSHKKLPGSKVFIINKNIENNQLSDKFKSFLADNL